MLIKKRTIQILVLMMGSITSLNAAFSSRKPQDNQSYYRKLRSGYLKKQYQNKNSSRIATRYNKSAPKQKTTTRRPRKSIEPSARPICLEETVVPEPIPTPPAIEQQPAIESYYQFETKTPKTESSPAITEDTPAYKSSYMDSRYKKASKSGFSQNITEEKLNYKPPNTDFRYKWKNKGKTARATISGSDHSENRWEAKIRGGAFIPRSDLFRDIYGTALGNFDGEFAGQFHKYLQAWININFALAHGYSLGFHNTTKIWIVNSSLGLKTPFDINDWFRVYIGIGPTFGAIRIKDESQFTGCNSSTKSSIGLVAKSGVNLFFRTHWFVDIFADYVYQKADFEKDVNASGLRVGAGIGVTF